MRVPPQVPNYNFKGLFWLFMGAANSDAKLYDAELQAIAAAHPENFRLDYAISREGAKNKRGGKMYIQVRRGRVGWSGQQYSEMCATVLYL